MSFYHKIFKSGGAYVVTLPNALLRALGWLPGSYISFTVIEGRKLLLQIVPDLPTPGALKLTEHRLISPLKPSTLKEE